MTTEGGTDAGENISAYWKGVFARHPELLKPRSNAELYRIYVSEHPGQAEVPKSARQGLSNVKTTLRQAKGKKRSPPARRRSGSTASLRTTTPTAYYRIWRQPSIISVNDCPISDVAKRRSPPARKQLNFIACLRAAMVAPYSPSWRRPSTI